jgi:hypothetical protein
MKRGRGSPLPHEVFLSHASNDRRMAARLATVLREDGVPVWYSQTNLLGAQQWHDEIGATLARCDWFLLLLSPPATSSRWVKRELLYALRSARYDDRILPINYRACDPSRLSWTLDDFQAVDFTGDFESGCRALLRTWGLGFRGTGSRSTKRA